jgi:mucin-19
LFKKVSNTYIFLVKTTANSFKVFPISLTKANRLFVAKNSYFFLITLFLSQHQFVIAQAAPNALPTGGHVVAGNVAISQTQNATSAAMNINQTSQRAIVNWDSFSVGKNATVNFNQPNASAVILNRVTSATPSMINGAVNANGQVVLVNPNGVTFGRGADINAAGVVASTMDIANKDFMNGKSTYNGNGKGAIVNEGRIATNTDGGYIALLAPEVRNQGYLLAMKGAGTVAIGAGEQITLDFKGNSLISLKVDKSAYQTLIENRHVVETSGGLVVLAAGAANQLMGSVIKNTGRIAANSMVNNGGVIELVAAKVTQAGTVAANSQGGQGGQVNLVGKDITLAQDSKTTATGAQGGGQVNIGLAATQVSGGTQVNAQIPSQLSNAQAEITSKANAALALSSKQMAKTVTVEQGATVDASASQSGNGGMIAIWSEIKTIVAGSLKATGGMQSGNGGFIETSSKGVVELAKGFVVNTSAALGKLGTWLLDPIDLVIDAGAANVISAALENNNVTIEVNGNVCPSLGSCTQNGSGSLTIASGADILKAGTTASTLRLISSGIFNLNANISGENLNVIINSSIAYLNVGTSITASQVTVQAQTIHVNGNINAMSNSPLSAAIQLLAQALYISGRLSTSTALSNNNSNTNNNTNTNTNTNTVTYNGTLIRAEDLPAFLRAQNNNSTNLDQVYSSTAANDNSASNINTQTNSIYLQAANDITLYSTAEIKANGTTGGYVNITAQAFNAQSGSLIQANGNNGPGGVININAVNDIHIQAARIEASGSSNGGSITMITTQGDLTLNGSTIQTNGSNGRGGSIGISARDLLDIQASTIESIGHTHGGTLLIGNDANYGTLPFALYAAIDQYSTLSAHQRDLTEGNHNGGFIETSGQTLSMMASINAGRGGMWLLDPYDYSIGAIQAGYIVSALNAGINVSISSVSASITTSGGNVITGTSTTAGNDSITISNAISATGSGNLSFIGSTINLNADISTGGSQTYTGNVILGASVTLQTSAISGNGSVIFSARVDSSAGNYYGLTVTNGSSNVSFGAAIGGNSPTSALGYLTITGVPNNSTAQTTILYGSVTTSGAQSYGGNVQLTGDVTLATRNNDVTIVGNITAVTITNVLQFTGSGSYILNGVTVNPGSSPYSGVTLGDTGTLSWDGSDYSWISNVTTNSARLLVVGGGGGGGNWGGSGGGGGGGAVVSSDGATLSSGTAYSVRVGSGGLVGGAGGSSLFDSILSAAGGSGGSLSSGNGGASGNGTPGGTSGIYASGSGYVYNGGGRNSGSLGSGGSNDSGSGGSGTISSITGSSIYYGGGGGGGYYLIDGASGGNGGGGRGANQWGSPPGSDGANNFGGGGGGNAVFSAGSGRGGSGLVVLNYAINRTLLINAGSGQVAISGAVNVSGGISITSSNAANMISGDISGSTAITYVGSANTGRLTLSGNNSQTGATTVSSGTIIASSSNAFGTGVVGIGSLGKIDLQYAGTVALGSTLNIDSGGSIINSINTSNLSVSGASTLAGDITTSGTQLYSGAVTLSGDRALIGSIITTNGITGGANGLTITGNAIFNDVVNGVTNLSVSNASTLAGDITTSSAQRYSGAVTLSGGDRTLTGAGISLTGTVNGAFGLIINDSGATTISSAIGASTPLTGLTITSASLSAGDIKLATGGSISITNTSDSTISGVIAGTGVSLAKSGIGLLSLTNAASTYTGITTINNGTLQVTSLADGGVASSIGQSTNAAENLIFNGGALKYAGSTVVNTNRLFTIGTLGGTLDGSGTGSGVVNFTNDGDILLSGNGNRRLTFVGTLSNNQFSPVIPENDGAGGITTVDNSAGAWIILGGTTFRVSSGFVNLARLSSRSILIMSGTAILDLAGASLTIASISGESTNSITNSITSTGVTLTLTGATPGSFAGLCEMAEVVSA